MGRGADRERELRDELIGRGIGALRIPGSGGGTALDLPDLLVSGNPSLLALEVKYTTSERVYFTTDEIDALERFAELWGATPLLVSRFSRDTTWYVHHTMDDYIFEKRTQYKNVGVTRSAKDEYETLEKYLDE